MESDHTKENEQLDNTSEKPILRAPNGHLIKGTASINPLGKPKGTRHLSTLLMQALLKQARNEKGDELEETHADLLIKRVLSDAIKKGKGVDLIFDRVEGKPDQAIDLTSNGETVGNTAASDSVMEIARKVSEELKKQKT